MKTCARCKITKPTAPQIMHDHFQQVVRDYLTAIDANETDSVEAAERGLNALYWRLRQKLYDELYVQSEEADRNYNRGRR